MVSERASRLGLESNRGSKMRDAEPMDVYADATGKLWRVVSVCHEPTVVVEEVEPSGHTSDPMEINYVSAQSAVQAMSLPRKGEFIRTRRSGACGARIWDGFRRIWRAEKTTFVGAGMWPPT